MNKASLKTLIRYKNYLQNFSTLYLQGAFLLVRIIYSLHVFWYNADINFISRGVFMSYISTIKIALILFPILAFVITIPYMIANYRKYGSVNKLRTVIFYSFILYLLAAYSLVNLPLPDPETVHTTYTDKLNLVPFSFVADFFNDSPFVLTDPSTWIDSMKYPSFYVPAFNVLMLVPFGIYMRYYFKCSFKKTILLTALVSLFFELTQLSGLYFIYPGPYRLCDIDDIIQNTAGGALGYFIGQLAVWVLPSRDAIDEKSFEEGSRVSSIRVMLSLLIDAAIVYVPYSFLNTTVPVSVLFALYFALVPLFNGKTLGSALLKFGVEFKDNKAFRTVLRGILITAYFNWIPLGLLTLMDVFNFEAETPEFLVLFAGTLLVFVLYFLIILIVTLFNRRFLFDRLTGAEYQSTIDRKA